MIQICPVFFHILLCNGYTGKRLPNDPLISLTNIKHHPADEMSNTLIHKKDAKKKKRNSIGDPRPKPGETQHICTMWCAKILSKKVVFRVACQHLQNQRPKISHNHHSVLKQKALKHKKHSGTQKPAIRVKNRWRSLQTVLDPGLVLRSFTANNKWKHLLNSSNRVTPKQQLQSISKIVNYSDADRGYACPCFWNAMTLNTAKVHCLQVNASHIRGFWWGCNSEVWHLTNVFGLVCNKTICGGAFPDARNFVAYICYGHWSIPDSYLR